MNLQDYSSYYRVQHYYSLSIVSSLKAINKISHIIVLTYTKGQIQRYKRDLNYYTRHNDIRVVHKRFDESGGVIKFQYIR